ncbi:uncharacterized protein MONOS_8263 [Monocercomonoides exilis]|uniref:uncharacterized protein n=1 Tax=Monocercomonoides exilis TaxID=2049356 RepID=UPI00355A4DB0|nr:hypothetical protein MONOS_8263 [Monocercomonoides exilis]|eukprot:MONOS_8263.1-p1 / transcript=MONOS_8263.1 / gene=MONOS_8263 / organism=Monocercomonoides_exilis_PA203 / gene_product=unspecified product / transcript_product=unspecified product / location=Mono_scaffold00307:38117-39892(+) / protein_length=592 / sequence_SO=supercontig / SO=protein_coding / is_pseudo=false
MMIPCIAFVFALGLNAVEVQAGPAAMTTLWASDRENGIGCLTKAVNSSMRVVRAKLIGVQKGSIGEFVAGSEVILQDCVIEATNTEKSPFLLAGSSLVANGIEIVAQQHGSVACFCENRDGQEELLLKDSRFDNLMCVGESSFLPVQGKGMSVVDCAFNNATKQRGFVGIPHAPGCLETHLSGSSFFNCWNVFYGGVMGGMNVHVFASSNCSFCQCKHNLQFQLVGDYPPYPQPTPPINETYEDEKFDSRKEYASYSSSYISVTFINCIFSSCKGSSGGGLYVQSGYAKVDSCTFESCSAESSGGALCFSGYGSSGYGSSLNLKKSKFIKCSTTGIEGDSDSLGSSSGGAVYISGSCYISELTGEECVSGSGGFMYVSSTSDAMWVGLTIKKCKTTVGNGWNLGGAILFSSADLLTIKESLFQKCEAGFSGGALAFYYVYKANDFHILNCKFRENKAIRNMEYVKKEFEDVDEENRIEFTKKMCVSDIFVFENETHGVFTKDNFVGTTSSSRSKRTYSRSQGNFDNLIKGALSTGGIIGLVIGLVAAVVIIVVVIIIVMRVLKKKKVGNSDKDKEMETVEASKQGETASEA